MKKIRMYQIAILIAILILLAVSIFILKSRITTINIIIWGSVILFSSSAIYNYLNYKRTKAMELQLPRFLRSISEYSKSGMNLYDSFKNTSKENFGPLTDELKKIVAEASWNVGMDKAIKRFVSRTESKRIKKIMLIILQAYQSGGNITRISQSLAANMEKIKEIEDTKKNLMSQQVMMMYAVFFVFIGISLLILKFMMPMLSLNSQMGGETFGLSTGGNPCDFCKNPITCISCPVFTSMSLAVGLSKSPGAKCYYKGLFFTMVLIQGIFSGLISGVIESNSLRAGIKHVIVMSVSGALIFLIVAWLGII